MQFIFLCAKPNTIIFLDIFVALSSAPSNALSSKIYLKYLDMLSRITSDTPCALDTLVSNMEMKELI